MEDWKSKLEALKGFVPEAADEPSSEMSAEPATPAKKETLHILIEKKGRGGKTATIIEGFTCNDEDLKEIATKLRNRLGTGGSSRGGEILLQGDCKTKAAELLRTQGYKVKG